MKKLNYKFIIGGIILMGLVAYLIFLGVSSSSVYYLTVAEAVEKGSEQQRNFRIDGAVKPGTIIWDAKAVTLKFEITDGEKSIPVVYRDVAPDNFVDGAKVVVEGKMQSEGTFLARKIMTKCPSKYE
ncbi:MAG: cytochrome c maturation protein CcmE [Actinobacteria bacterium]|nr:cytochrome c maturation protein CcmE [Actinomycetota bacterium]